MKRTIKLVQSGLSPYPVPKDRLLSSFTLLSSATLLAILFSVVTNKAIALLAGPEGIALMGLFRTMGGFVTGTILMGYATIVVQRVSKARDQGEVDSVLGAATLLFLLQAGFVAILAVTAAEPLGRWLLGSPLTGVTASEVRIVLVMSVVNLLLALVNAALNGQPDVRPLTTVYLATALSSLLLIYPLLGLGRTGLAVNVGSGGLVGACLGLYYLRKLLRYSPSGHWASRWTTLRSTFSTSLWLTAQNLVVMGGMLAMQKTILRAQGLEALGVFSGALLIVDTVSMAIMSSARSYALPALGRLSDEAQKHALISKVLALRIMATTAASAFCIFAAKPALALLFSSRFLAATEVLGILSLSLLPLGFSWSFNSFLLHKNDVRTFVLIDAAWICTLLLAMAACAYLGQPVSVMAWVYFGSAVVTASVYAGVCVRRYGGGLLTGASARLGAGCLLWLLAAFFLARRAPLAFQAVFIVASLVAAGAAGFARYVDAWLELKRSAAS